LSDISTLKGVGPKLTERLAKLNIYEVADLLFHLPTRYQDRTVITPISQLEAGTEYVIEGEITGSSVRFGRKRSLLCSVEDGSGTITFRLFHFNRVQQNSLSRGKVVRCFGEVRSSGASSTILEMSHPEYQILTDNQNSPKLAESLTPIYPTTEGLRQRTLYSLTSQALTISLTKVEEYLPKSTLDSIQNFGGTTLPQALRALHRPESTISTQQLNIYRDRIVFEELLARHLSLHQLLNKIKLRDASPLNADLSWLQLFLNKLPFSLTAAQQRATDTILADLQQPHPMQRLLQGDVGSGKTVVALIATLHAYASGAQSALMAPTELLAKQHYKNITAQLSQFTEIGSKPKVSFLSGSIKGSARREILEQLADGEIDILIGTHALFQKEVKFKKLALTIIDEQHRFGVEQRLALQQKGEDTKTATLPHQLIMTATPIPRTLAMSFYADLESTVIDELPPGRTPIKTVTIPESRREDILERVHASCIAGKQVYWVCPLIEESDILQCQAAVDSAQNITEQLPNLKIGLVHGRLKADEKEQVMNEFHQGNIDILVATTVIEVGVDVPNASLMIIENSERLGLSQLHQLRGRVGRGKVESSCVLLYRSPLSRVATERLQTIRNSNDGFQIAQKDLEMRGPGDFLGKRQTGIPLLRFADLIRDQHLIPLVEEQGAILLTQIDNPTIASNSEKLIKRWLPNSEKGVRSLLLHLYPSSCE